MCFKWSLCETDHSDERECCLSFGVLVIFDMFTVNNVSMCEYKDELSGALWFWTAVCHKPLILHSFS